MIWYIEDAGKAKKIPEEVLKYKIENYEVSGDKLVVNEEIKNWVPLRETQIWKEHRKDTEKDGGSNFEKESTPSHMWRCKKCGNIIQKTPCPYCQNTSDSSNRNTQRRRKNNIGIWLLIVIMAVVIISGILEHSTDDKDKRKGEVFYGKISDIYDDDGDGWVDRAYNRTAGMWIYYLPGELSMDSAKELQK